MRGTFKQILGSLLVCALLIAAAIPAGFMPNIARAAAPDGTLYPLVLCTAYGEKTVYVPAAQSPESPAAQDAPSHDETVHSLCLYAPVAAQDAPAAMPLTVPFVYTAARDVIAADAVNAAKPSFKTWQAQAPPLS
ncbi:MAG: hypothetical protein Q8K65_01620 [Alphaproteobacteria bacterium]|nr:hypothetical protein [Alphaproteobacteria bacterium]